MNKLTGPTVFEDHGIDPMYQSMLEIESPSKKDVEMVSRIKEYVDRQAKKDGTLEHFNIINDLKFRLGAPRVGETKLSQVYRYVDLRMKAKLMEQEAQSMEA